MTTKKKAIPPKRLRKPEGPSPTPADKRLIEFFVDFMTENQYVPTVTDVQEKFRLRVRNWVQWRIKRLVELGLIERRGKCKPFKVTEAGFAVAGRPVPPKIMLLSPVVAEGVIEEVLVPDKSMLLSRQELFALTYGRGERFEDLWFGDLLYFRQAPAVNGDTVAVVFEDTYEIARVKVHNGFRATLVSSIAERHDRIVQFGHLNHFVRGVLIAVVRKYEQ